MKKRNTKVLVMALVCISVITASSLQPVVAYNFWITNQLESQKPTIIAFDTDELTHSGVRKLAQALDYRSLIINLSIASLENIERETRGPIVILGHGAYGGVLTGYRNDPVMSWETLNQIIFNSPSAQHYILACSCPLEDINSKVVFATNGGIDVDIGSYAVISYLTIFDLTFKERLTGQNLKSEMESVHKNYQSRIITEYLHKLQTNDFRLLGITPYEYGWYRDVYFEKHIDSNSMAKYDHPHRKTYDVHYNDPWALGVNSKNFYVRHFTDQEATAIGLILAALTACNTLAAVITFCLGLGAALTPTVLGIVVLAVSVILMAIAVTWTLVSMIIQDENDGVWLYAQDFGLSYLFGIPYEMHYDLKIGGSIWFHCSAIFPLELVTATNGLIIVPLTIPSLPGEWIRDHNGWPSEFDDDDDGDESPPAPPGPPGGGVPV